MPAILPVSILFTGILTLVQVPLTVVVALRRGRTGVQFLDGGDDRLLRLSRAHANFTETVPAALLAMAAAELSGAPHALLMAGGISIVVGRALHYATLVRSGVGLGRAAGMVMTLFPIGTFAGYAILKSVG